MLNIAYYEAEVNDFRMADGKAILGALTQHHGFALEIQQKIAWQAQIELLQALLPDLQGHIYFEFAIPRMGKRADVILVSKGIVFVIEFKVGSASYDRAAIDQVHDYALDLKNFHKGSHNSPIVPVLIATSAKPNHIQNIAFDADMVSVPICVAPNQLGELIDKFLAHDSSNLINAALWSRSGYHPTPTIIEAAQALYRDHDVRDISRSDAGAQNLTHTSDCISQIIEDAKRSGRKSICFVTGVPGAGKTLAGLNIATSRSKAHSDEHAVFLSGNGPLVEVLREALARDQAMREGIKKPIALRQVESFVQNIHHFRDDALKSDRPPVEKVVIFDEAQRAWNRTKAADFMQRKRGYAGFDMSEPEFLVSVMDRHTDWCVIVCLIGGGQEINTGEAGLAEWLSVMGTRFTDWDVHISNRLDDSDYVWDAPTRKTLATLPTTRSEALHLGVSIRSFRAEALSEFIGHVVENRPDKARLAYVTIRDKYPIHLTRSTESARNWLKAKARGTERYGLLASSGGHRLRPEGISVKHKIDAPIWFLNGKEDVRSSFYLEEVASEFDVQGLELDWAGIAWDVDFRYVGDAWQHFGFKGTKWQQVKKLDNQLFLKNAYRVLLTRARQGMVIFIPCGAVTDPTRPPSFYDETFTYLERCGITALPLRGMH
jgi:hypothetical protein